MNNYQFAIGNNFINISENTTNIKLSDSKVLSYDSKLPIKIIKDLDGNTWHLIGWSYQTNNVLESPERQISLNQTDNIPALSEGWGGRWLLISNNTLYLDAGGSFGCYYSIIDEELYISSSVAILKKQHKSDLKSSPDINHNQGLDFYPGSYTKYESIYRLLPSQILNFSQQEIDIQYRSLFSKLNFNNYEEILSYIENLLIKTLQEIASTEENIWIPLTGGNDSRLILAAAYKAGVEATTFTYNKPFTEMSMADKTIPPLLAKELGYKHVFINREDYSEARLHDFDVHTAEMIPGSDRKYHAYGQLEKIPETAFLLRGGMFEIGRCYYYDILHPDVSQAKESIYKAFDINTNHKDSVSHTQGINQWVKFIEDNPEPDIDWRDRFYYDIRIGSWLSSVEQGLDITPPKRVHVANNHFLMSALLNIPTGVRKQEKHVNDLINRMAPALIKYPINPRDPYLVRGARKMARQFLKS